MKHVKICILGAMLLFSTAAISQSKTLPPPPPDVVAPPIPELPQLPLVNEKTPTIVTERVAQKLPKPATPPPPPPPPPPPAEKD